MRTQLYNSLSIANPDAPGLNAAQKIFSAVAAGGLMIMIMSWAGFDWPQSGAMLLISILLMSAGIIGFGWHTYMSKLPGIKNNGIWISSMTNRGLWGWLAGIIITAFYICLYIYPETLGLNGDGNTGLIALFDPLSIAIKGKPASQWFMYGTLYTLAILLFGIRFLFKYRHNRYHVLRTWSVMFFQLVFAYLIPEVIEYFNKDTADKWFDKDYKNMWPLDYDFFDAWHIDNMLSANALGLSTIIFGILLVFFISPYLTYKYGKRWYCSWVCGCGGLAETAGDSFRHLSDKSLRAWKIERWLIHGILLFSVVMTIAVIYSYLGTDPDRYFLTKTHFTILSMALLIGALGLYTWLDGKQGYSDKFVRRMVTTVVSGIVILLAISFFSGNSNAFLVNNYTLRSAYGFYIGAVFSGIVGVGFYPIMGSRVWCRFGCPMAALLGIQQKLFSRFRITTNGGQCISCGNCSIYCEMGIDVRHYAQRGQNIVRASCVGCGICAAVCPRGVLRLENARIDIFEKTDDIRVHHIHK